MRELEQVVMLARFGLGDEGYGVRFQEATSRRRGET
jgi:hypothetical protein